MDRRLSIAFALLTPFFFLEAGTRISASALAAGAAVIAALFGVKMATKLIGAWRTCSIFRIPSRERTCSKLLMATGLTFGSISALFWLNYGLIDDKQYTDS
jgi:glutathione-regulated potassium-efflux system ancillary protein KefC